MRPPASLAPGAVVAGRYRIDRLIGQGGYGAVYAATQLNLARAVALKIMHADVVRRPEALARFEREAQLTQQLAHPNVVRLFDFGRTDHGVPFIVWELLVGRSLECELATAGALPEHRVSHIAQQTLKALMEAHALGIVHRDVKPANIWLSDFAGEPDFVKVLDFGIARAPSGAGGITQEGVSLGTPAYMAPEQVVDTAVDGRTDLYALGLVMAEMLAGDPVFRGATAMQVAMMQIEARPVPLSPTVLQSTLGPVVVRATQKDPSRRFTSAFEMLDVLRGAGAGPGVERSPVAVSAPPPSPAIVISSSPGVSASQLGYLPTASVETPAAQPTLASPQPLLPAGARPASASLAGAPTVEAPSGTLGVQLVPPHARPAAPRNPWLGPLAGAVAVVVLGAAGWATWSALRPDDEPKRRERRAAADDDDPVGDALDEALEDSIHVGPDGIDLRVPGAQVKWTGCSDVPKLAKYTIAGVDGAAFLAKMAPLGYQCQWITSAKLASGEEQVVVMSNRKHNARVTFRTSVGAPCSDGVFAKDADSGVNVCVTGVDKPEAQRIMKAVFGDAQ